MRESQYILTNLIPSEESFLAYYRDLASGEEKIRKESLNERKRENIPKINQYFIERNISPITVFFSDFRKKGDMSFDSFKRMSGHTIFLDIEAMNENEMPNPEKDEIICISYGNSEHGITTRFNGEYKPCPKENHTTHRVCFSDEKDVIKGTFNDFKKMKRNNFLVVGYNHFSFDNRFIRERAEKYGIKHPIVSYTSRTLFGRNKTNIIPGYGNIDLLYFAIMANIPSSKLEHVARNFGIECKKIQIEDLWRFYKEKEYPKIIQHNFNDVQVNEQVFNKFLKPIYFLAENTIGTFEYAFYSNPIRNVVLKKILDKYRDQPRREVLDKIDRIWPEISFTLDETKVRGKLEIRVNTKLERAILIDLNPIIWDRVKKSGANELNCPTYHALEELMKKYSEQISPTKEDAFYKMLIGGLVDDLILIMMKKKMYKLENIVRETRREIENKNSIYVSSRRFMLVKNSLGGIPLENVILNKNPKIFLGSYNGLIIGSVPKKRVGMPERFNDAFLNDLFSITLKEEPREMKNFKEKLETGKVSLDDLKIEVRGYDEKKLSRSSKKKEFVDQVMEDIGREIKPEERFYVVKSGDGFISLEDARKKIIGLDQEYYSGEFSELWEIYKRIEGCAQQNSLRNFF